VELTVTTRYHGQKEAALSNDLSIHNSDGHDEVDHFVLGPNDLFGEMALFTSETVRAEAVAMSRSCVLRIPSQAVHSLLASNKRLQEFVAMTAVERLRETEVFRRCTPSTVARLVNFMTQAEFCAGDVLFHDVDSLCPIYFIVLGCVEVIQPVDTEGADTIKRRVLSANAIFGTEHLVGGRAVHATARALEQTTVLVIQRNDIDKLCRKDARFHQALLSSTTEAEAERRSSWCPWRVLQLRPNWGCQSQTCGSMRAPQRSVNTSSPRHLAPLVVMMQEAAVTMTCFLVLTSRISWKAQKQRKGSPMLSVTHTKGAACRRPS